MKKKTHTHTQQQQQQRPQASKHSNLAVDHFGGHVFDSAAEGKSLAIVRRRNGCGLLAEPKVCEDSSKKDI
jgi:hypothetical protein